MSDDSQRRPSEGHPRIIPIYLPGSAVPRLEWVNEPQAPRDWGVFVSETYLPHAWEVDVFEVASVEEWRRASDAYMDELVALEAEWEEFEEAVEAGRLLLSESQLAEHPSIRDLFLGYQAEIAENKETLAAFAQMMQEEIDDIEDDIERARDDDDE